MALLIRTSIAGYISACSPEVILKLIQKARVQTQLVEALEELKRLIDVCLRDDNPTYGKTASMLCDVRESLQAALAAAKETM